MPSERLVMRLDRARGVVELTVSGPLTWEVIEDAANQFKASAEAFAFHGFVWDLRAADASGVNAEILTRSLREHPLPALGREDMRSAAVISDSTAVSAGNLWVKLGENYDKAERRIFNDIDEARLWVSRSRRKLPAFPVEIDREHGIVHFILTGIVSAEEIIRTGNLFQENPRDFHLKGFVWDMRDADLSGYDYQGMVRVFETNPKVLRAETLRIATVPAKIIDRQLLVLWSRVAESYDRNERQIFADIEDACRWVAENPDSIPPTNDELPRRSAE